jgi:hypothetical protein
LLFLVTGYSLNVLKFIIPHCLGLLPGNFLIDLQVQYDSNGILQLFLLGDILHFAAIALMVMFFVKQLRHFEYWSLLFAMIICFLSPFIWDKHCSNAFVNYLLQLIGGQPPHVFFPLFPWLVYPLIGLSAGYFIRQYGVQVFAWLRNFGILFITYGLALKTFFIKQESISFYRTLPADTFIHAGIVLISLYVWKWLHGHVSENYFFRVLQYMSRHITQIYFIQWILIIWMLPISGYHELDYNQSLAAIAVTSILTVSISVTLNMIIKTKTRGN